MTMTDPIADMLTRNANHAPRVGFMPYSKLKAAIAKILVEEGYIASIDVEDAKVGQTLVLTQVRLAPRGRYRGSAAPCPSARSRQVHQPAQGPRRPRRGNSVHVFRPAHRPSGSGREGVGGEVLAYIW